MDFWTIQSKTVASIIEHNGVYQPDFTKSPQVHIEDYLEILQAFNKLNSTNYKGLIFCMAPPFDEENGITDFSSFLDVQALFARNSYLSDSLGANGIGGYSLFDNEHMLMHIEDSDFDMINLIPIDFWNFVFYLRNGRDNYRSLYEFQAPFGFYSGVSFEQFIACQQNAIEMGRLLPPIMVDSMLQLHIPYIKKEAVLESFKAADILV